MELKKVFVILLLLCTYSSLYAQLGAASEFSCFGVDAKNPTVCSMRGRCFVKDTCICDYGYAGNNCDQMVSHVAYNFTLNTSYMRQPIDILVDDKGIPHFPSNLGKYRKEVMYAQGFFSAKQRLWEYVMNRAIVDGKSAELLGDQLLNTDINFRVQNYRKSAQAQWNSGGTDPDVANDLTWFTDGINEYIASTSPSAFSTQMKTVAPLLPGGKPTLFGPVDILVMQKLAISTLAQNINQEVTREKTRLAGNSVERVAKLHPPAWRKGDPTILTAKDLNICLTDAQIKAIEAKWMDNSGATAVYTPPVTSGINTMSSLRFRKLLQKMDLTDYITPETKMIDIEQDAEFQKFMNFHEGASNSETISKKLSAEKESIIINDPHVSLSLASFWDFRVVGKQAGYYVFFSPYMFGGNTGKIHTSMTSGAVDTQDLYKMVDGPNGGYIYHGVEKQYEVRMETIKILRFNATTGAPYYATYTHPCFDTVLGPVINLLRGFPMTGIKYVEHGLVGSSDPKASYLEGLRGIEFADDCDDFDRSVSKFNTFGLSMTCGQKNGKIQYTLASGIPIRAPGHTGAMPVLGDGTYDWLGLVPNWDKPSAMEPERGYIVTNNHRVVPPGYKYNLGWDTAVSLRAQVAIQAIETELANNGKISAEALRALQVNKKSLLFLEYRPLFQRILSTALTRYPTYAAYFNMLSLYDGAVDIMGNDTAITLFEVVRAKTLAITAPQGASAFNPLSPPMLMKENDTICAQSFPFTNCDDYLIEVIKSSVDALVSIYGAIPRWGVDAVVGKHVITNVPLSMDPRTAAAATVIIPTGATYSHDVSVPTIDAKLSLSSAFGASLRIMTLGKDKDHIFISMPGGNHEDVASPFYKNLVPYYVNGSYAVIHVDLEQ